LPAIEPQQKPKSRLHCGQWTQERCSTH